MTSVIAPVDASALGAYKEPARVPWVRDYAALDDLRCLADSCLTKKASLHRIRRRAFWVRRQGGPLSEDELVGDTSANRQRSPVALMIDPTGR
jgi:hypothetical protein